MFLKIKDRKMKVLLVNKYNHIAGGADTYFISLKDLLRSKGHDVAEFCIRDPKNIDSEYEEYFISGLTSRTWKNASAAQSAKALLNAIYNLEAKEKFNKLVHSFRPDIVHLQNIFYQISPSILSVTAGMRIPVVETLHDYHLICANNNLYCKEKICEQCIGGDCLKALKNRCYNNSLKATFLAVISCLTRKVFRLYKERVNLWICPSEFLYRKMIEKGIRKDKLRVIHNFIDQCSIEQNYSVKNLEEEKGFVLFSGRLEVHKGIRTLLKAAEMLREIKFIIAGEGELKKETEEFIRVRSMKNVELTGFVSASELKKLIASARIVLVPSEWYENYPYSVLEAMALGKAVIASDTGGIPELINNKTGILFPPGDYYELSEKIKALYNNPDERLRLGNNAKRKAEQENGKEEHYNNIIREYENLVKIMNYEL
ncbi:MAG: glycosyltransferase family 4 protein [Bacillota bacterium]